MHEDKGTLLKIERPFGRAVLLSDHKCELTFFHGALTCANPEGFVQFFGNTVRRVASLIPASRLHSDHVLLLFGPAADCDLAASFQVWLQQRGFSTGPLQFFFTRSEHPIEDGFFTCICATTVSLDALSDLEATRTLKWQALPTEKGTVGQVFADFVGRELQRIGGDDPMRFLDDLYAERGAPKLFDTETAHLEFAASIWSGNELRFWSRPVQYPK